MNIILVSRRHGRTTTLATWVPGFLFGCFLVGVVGLGYLGFQFFNDSDNTVLDKKSVQAWQETLSGQEAEVAQMRQYTEEQLQALTIRIAELQARLTRIDALGDRLVSVAKLDKGEFDFSQPPALGGPNQTKGTAFEAPDFTAVIDELADRIDNREQQLDVLESLLGSQKIESETFIAGRPIRKGWMSSRYGYRNDPFNGKIAWHEGVDFAGKDGSDIISVAAGVVTWAGKRYGYGLLVEINHGNGYTTRYAHAKEILVKTGDIVKKNQTLAKMGSTGRSTGPHVHFEVRKDGRPVDPNKYIHRAARR